jgi:hypothetical protein
MNRTIRPTHCWRGSKYMSVFSRSTWRAEDARRTRFRLGAYPRRAELRSTSVSRKWPCHWPAPSAEQLSTRISRMRTPCPEAASVGRSRAIRSRSWV